MAIFLTALLVVACGPSPEEIDNIATITCNVMSESRNMDGALRIKEVNAVREKIGAAPYLGTDQEIRESFKYGICEELVKGNPDYDKVLSERRLAEVKRLQIAWEIREKRKKEERIAREKREKEKRIAREKRKKEERIAREKREEEERIAREKREVKVAEARKKWRDAIQKDLGNRSLSVTRVAFDTDTERLMVQFKCHAIEGYPHKVVVQFKNGLGVHTTAENRSGFCGFRARKWSVPLRGDELLSALEKAKDPKSLIEEAYILITGVDLLEPRSRRKKLASKSFPPLEYNSRLKDPIRIDLTL